MSTATVNVATRPSLFRSTYNSNLVLRGLTFEYANSCLENAAVSFQVSNNILIDADNFVWNNSGGLAFGQPQNITVQFSYADHNGEQGFGSLEAKYALWNNDYASYNNWRGAQGSFYWSSGAHRFHWTHTGTVLYPVAAYNQTSGLHLDTDTSHVTVN